MVDELFAQFDGYLARQGYIARGGQILDASIVLGVHRAGAAQPQKKRAEDASIKADETPEGRADKPAKRSQKDVAAH
ncbi:MAG: hypothetical protein ACJA1E_001061 [Paracoccaceae bacterium]|jgi:IS5 family transposase